ncbi:MAG: DUF3466 family protein, partial [Thermomicrobiales bacterium]|nr:DUF3466 family protein [Thermomicrobiales bacterium]
MAQRIRLLAICSALALLIPVSSAAQTETAPVVYTVIDLGPLMHPDQENCFGIAAGATINDVGVGNRAVGSVYQDEERAVSALFSANGPRKMVSGEGGGVAYAVNGSGQIAGAVFTDLPEEPCGEPTGSQPARWNAEFRIELLELPDGATGGAAVAINQNGVIAGWVETGIGRRAALWTEDSVTIIQHVSIDGTENLESMAVGINDDGTVSGTLTWTQNRSFRSVPFVWDGVNARYLEPFLGDDAYATSINNAGVVAGAVIESDGIRQAALWWRGQIVSLAPLSDRPNAIVTDINNAGFAVGYGEREDGLTRAMIWIAGSPTDLNDITPQDAGWLLQMAVGINDDGVIAGWGDLDG